MLVLCLQKVLVIVREDTNWNSSHPSIHTTLLYGKRKEAKKKAEAGVKVKQGQGRLCLASRPDISKVLYSLFSPKV